MNKLEILEKIEPLFFEKTFKEVSVQNIANFLGIKKASLYYYFPSKDTLFQELLEYSYEKYSIFLLSILDEDLDNFIEKFIKYPKEAKNLFSIVNQNAYLEESSFKEIVKTKQKSIFNLISNRLDKKYSFNKNKTFIFIATLEDIGKKRCIFKECPVKINDVISEIYKIFKQ